MSPTTAHIGLLRKMTGLENDASWSDADLQAAIERRPLVDRQGRGPSEAGWDEGYDLNAAASDVWAQRAAPLAGDYDFNAEDGVYKRSQIYEQYMRMSEFYRSRRSAGTIKQIAAPTQ